MSNRLNQEREARLSPIRFDNAIESLSCFSEVTFLPTVDKSIICFLWKGEKITFYPYSGWATGKGIVDGRGLKNLLKQLK